MGVTHCVPLPPEKSKLRPLKRFVKTCCKTWNSETNFGTLRSFDLTYFYVDVAGCSGVPAVLTIYTNHPSGNLGHRNKIKFVVGERPATMYIQNS